MRYNILHNQHFIICQLPDLITNNIFTIILGKIEHFVYRVTFIINVKQKKKAKHFLCITSAI